MKHISVITPFGRMAAVLLLAAMLVSCATYTPPRPQMGVVIEPSALPGAVRTTEFDLGAQYYVWQGQGLNYVEAGVLPVLLLFRNHSGRYPVIYPQECRGIGAGGAEYPAWSMEQAAERVFASTAYKKSAEAAVVGGLTGGALGAGLGALIGSGFNHGWGAGPGALIGAGIGAVGGAALAQQPSLEQYRSTLYQEMATYAWRPAAIAPTALVPGYLYFPANVGIHSVRVLLRVDNYVQTYIVPISQPVW
jgi:hypothetical protein